jgi:hypothetical protein
LLITILGPSAFPARHFLHEKEETVMGAPHVYSDSPEASRKRSVDLQITGGDVAKEDKIDMNSEDYLKQLIKLSSKGKVEVSNKARKLQFFIVKGGAEGFLLPWYKNRDAGNRVTGGATTSSANGTSMRFSDTDLLVVFDGQGKLVSSALLRRPIEIKTPDRPHMWTEGTAKKVYDAWDGSPVSIYRNNNPRWDIHYYGLWIDDSKGYYSSGQIRVDLHKQEATNGCIFIVDGGTPQYVRGNKAAIAALNSFEPQLIKDVQKSIGAQVKSNIGIMHMVEIQ